MKQKAKSILVIGMGRFGRHLATRMHALGNDVMAIDKNEEIVHSISAVIGDVLVGDCTDESVLGALGVGNFDVCFVSIGENFESSLVVTSLLKKMGAKHIVTKANKDIQTDILKKIGADEVVYPERELAEKLAVKYNSNSILDYIELAADFAVYETAIPAQWAGKTIGEIDVRRKYNLNILAVKNIAAIHSLPGAEYAFHPQDEIVVSGNPADIEKVFSRETFFTGFGCL